MCTDLERENPAPAPICFALVGECQNVSTSCDRGRRTPWPDRLIQRGRVYARVVVRGAPQGDGSPPIFQEPTPYPNLYAVIQYWIFYRNDLWEAQTGVGRIVQRHQSDWEQVTVGLSRIAPLFVAYSSHCGGQWLKWEEFAPSACRTDPCGRSSGSREARMRITRTRPRGNPTSSAAASPRPGVRTAAGQASVVADHRAADLWRERARSTPGLSRDPGTRAQS